MSENANAIRTACHAIAAAMVPATFATVAKTPLVQPDGTVPRCGVFLTRVSEAPDGDGNVGEIRFFEDVTIGFSIFETGLKAEELEVAIDARQALLLRTLLTTQDFTKFGAFFEEVTGVTRSKTYPPQSSAIFAIEWRLEVTFRARSEYVPTITDPLEGIDLRADPVGLDPDVIDSGFNLDLPQ